MSNAVCNVLTSDRVGVVRDPMTDTVKIENQSTKRSHKLDGIGVGRIRTFRFLPIPIPIPSLMIR